MADSFLVRLDLDRLAANLAAESGIAYNPASVAAWLREHDVLPAPGGPGWWLAEELSLELFSQGEIVGRRRLA